MSHRYTTSTNPFDEDDIDDETFLRNSRNPKQPHQDSFEQQIQSFHERKKEIENRTLQSTERSIGILRDSEQIGIATAEELSRQREQLERTDKRLDEINQTLRFSQKHINGIKSVFSSLKNYMSGRTDPQTPTSNSSQNVQPSQKEPESGRNNFDTHPAVRIKGLQVQDQVPSGSKEISARLEANLQEMSTSLSRLKGLATDLNIEIDSQNELIDNITDKTEIADITINKQNKDIVRLLKK